MLLVFVDLNLRIRFNHLAVDPQPHKSLATRLLNNLLVLPLLAPHQRRKHHETGTFLETQSRVDNLLHRLLGDRLAALDTMRNAGPGEQ